MIRQLIRRLFGRAPDRVVHVRAGYDLARTTDANRKHWAYADSLSADAANSLEIRKKLRERTRYEVANNSYVKGIVKTLANDTVGKGPRLQMIGKSRQNADIPTVALQQHLCDAGCGAEVAIYLEGRMGIEQVGISAAGHGDSAVLIAELKLGAY